MEKAISFSLQLARRRIEQKLCFNLCKRKREKKSKSKREEEKQKTSTIAIETEAKRIVSFFRWAGIDFSFQFYVQNEMVMFFLKRTKSVNTHQKGETEWWRKWIEIAQIEKRRTSTESNSLRICLQIFLILIDIRVQILIWSMNVFRRGFLHRFTCFHHLAFRDGSDMSALKIRISLINSFSFASRSDRHVKN